MPGRAMVRKALQAAAVAAVIASTDGAAGAGTGAGLRGAAAGTGNTTDRMMRTLSSVDSASGTLGGSFVLMKRFDLAGDPSEEFDVIDIPDANLTHSCSNYVDDGSTVFSRDGKLVLKVASNCEGGGCMNSGRVMSKRGFKYGLFTFSAKVPKCNHIWPALWLLPSDSNGEGRYGRWPCSGEIDVLETVHDQNFGAFNLVAGYGSTSGCERSAETTCDCIPGYCTSTTMNPMDIEDRFFVEDADCNTEHPTWEEHVFVLNWQPDALTTWVDPQLSFDSNGRLVNVIPKQAPASSGGVPTWRSYPREQTPTWTAVKDFMDQCFADSAQADAPFDDEFKIVMNIAVGGYGGAPCFWGSDSCQTTCGGALGAEMTVSDISVWERAA